MKSMFKNMKDARTALNRSDNSDILIEVDEEQRRRLQGAILEMYKELLSVCIRYKITPYLIGGSALGAVRHKGFIPWDDDIDIGMTRDDYTKFIEVFNKELSKKYIINAPNLSDNPKTRFTKIYKKGTVCREVFDRKSSLNGIFLDIFIIENVPRNKVIRKLRGTLCNALQFISSQVYLYENNNSLMREIYTRAGEGNYKSRMRIGHLFSFKPAKTWFDLVDKVAQYKKTGLYGIVTGRKHYFGEIFEEKVFFPSQYKEFEDIEAPVFNDLDTYLTNLYNNYMEIPPENKRERHYVVELKF